LLLDTENVRIRADITDQDEILSYLFMHEEVLNLLRDIARDGYFDNEQPVVIAVGDKFVVLEGNRRVSSLKALAEPDRIPSHAQRIRAATARAEDQDFPKRIRVMVAPDRSAALQVIARLHTRNPKKRWIREQQAMFYYDRVREGETLEDLRRDFPAEPNIRDFIVVGQMMELLRTATASNADAIEFIDSSKFSITTFEYLYDSMVFRDAVGMEVVDGIVRIPGRDAQFLHRLFNQIRIDMQSNRINTRKIRVNTDAHRDYVESLVAIASGLKSTHDEANPAREGTAPTDPYSSGDSARPDEDAAEHPGASERVSASADGGSSEVPDLSSDSAGEEVENDSPETGEVGGDRTESETDATMSAPDGPEEPPEATSPDRGKQRYDQKLDVAGMYLALTGAGIRVRWDELRVINVRTLPNATFDVVRTFIECAIKEYFSEAGDPVSHPAGGNNPVQLKHCLDHLDKRLGADPTVRNGILRLKSKQTSTATDYFSSAVALNDSNHEPDAVFTYDQVNQLWAQIKPLVKHLIAGPPSVN
jgi:hypothetical protein